jgi:hypothetical protein
MDEWLDRRTRVNRMQKEKGKRREEKKRVISKKIHDDKWKGK